MSTKLNAEELAANRYPSTDKPDPLRNDYLPMSVMGVAYELNKASAEGYADAIREVAQPIADERDELREALQAIADADNSDEAQGGEIYWAEALAPVVSKLHAILAKYP